MSSTWDGDQPIKLRQHATEEEKLRTHSRRRQTTDANASRARTRSRQTEDEADVAAEDDVLDEPWPTQTHTSVRRYDTTAPGIPKRTSQFEAKPTRVILPNRFSTGRLLIICGVGMMVMLLGWLGVSAFGQWWQGVQENATYGMPRTFQIDQYVNQDDTPAQPDHFIGLNLHGVILVLQINPMHPKENHTYPITTSSDPSAPVVVSFREVNGQQHMEVRVGHANSTPYTVELVNNGKTFVAPQAQ